MSFEFTNETALGLAVRVRPDWSQPALSGALVNARQHAWDDKRMFLAVTRLMADDDAQPGDLNDVIGRPDPRVADPGVPPERNSLYAADARDRLEDARRDGRHAAAGDRWDS